jgi:hypothetical protein
MDAQNKWSAARKVMKEIESRRVLSSQLAKVCVCAGQEREMRCATAGVTLWKQFCALV